jgi:hypothetical protein
MDGGAVMAMELETINKLYLELSQITTATTAKEKKLQVEVCFYRCRCELLQQLQRTMRDPERQLVCDILANGTLLPDPSRTRYSYFNEDANRTERRGDD